MWFAIQLHEIAVTSVLVWSSRLLSPEHEVHRIDTTGVMKERLPVTPEKVLHWERHFPERGPSFLQFFR